MTVSVSSYRRGVAQGQSNIKTDTMTFRYRNEVWEFPTTRVLPGVAVYNGYFYEAPVRALRKLAKENGHGN